LKEKAQKDAEKRNKNYEKMKQKAERLAEKEQNRLRKEREKMLNRPEDVPVMPHRYTMKYNVIPFVVSCKYYVHGNL
jgi:hypothetical protein